MAKEISLTLAGANEAITHYLNRFRFRRVPQEEREFLMQIQNAIRTIHVAQRGWLKVGLIANHRWLEEGSIDNADNHKGKLTQEALLEEARKTQNETSVFTEERVRKLQLAVSSERKSKKNEYDDLLAYIVDCCQGVLKVIHDIKGQPLFDYSEKILIAIMKALGGRYRPYQQSLDPLHGQCKKGNEILDNSGHCNGHAITYSQEVEKTGSASTLPRLDDSVYYAQIYQLHRYWSKWSCDVTSTSDFYLIFDKMLNHLKDNKIYGLNLNPNNKDHETHITVIRYIPTSNEFEFDDSNFGTVVFDNHKNFAIWLAHYICAVYCKMFIREDYVVKGEVYLEELGNQPINAKSSIPAFPKHTNEYVVEAMKSQKVTLAKMAGENITLTDAGFFKRHWHFILNSASCGLLSGYMVMLIFSLAVTSSALTLGISLAIFVAGGVIGAAVGLYLAKRRQQPHAMVDMPALKQTTTHLLSYLKSAGKSVANQPIEISQNVAAKIDRNHSFALPNIHTDIKPTMTSISNLRNAR